MNPYYITYYYGIHADQCTFERYKEAAGAGFNLMSIDKGSVGQRQQALCWCAELGVRATVTDNRIVNLLYNDWETRLEHPEVLDEAVRMVCNDYRDYPALYGYDLIDEPGAKKFPLLAALVGLFHKYDPDRICVINLFPNYASKEQLEAANYEEYLAQYLKIVKPDVLSYDHYHLRWSQVREERYDVIDPADVGSYVAGRSNADRLGFYKNLEDVRRYCLEYDVPYMVIVLLNEHCDYRYLTRAEISFEVWQTLAYGCTALSYFTYWTPGGGEFSNCMISAAGEKTAHYYDVQAVNAAIAPIGERIAQTRSEAVFHVGRENKKEYVTAFPAEGYGAVRAVSGGRYTVGFFEDGSFIIANKDYGNGSACAVETDAELEIFDAGAGTFVPVTENTFDIPAGGGVYLRFADRP